MMKKPTLWIFVLAVALVALPLAAQEEKPERTKDKEDLIERIRQAVKLPEAAEEAREAGVEEEEVKEVLEKGKEKKVPAGDMGVVLTEETRAVKEHGNIDNFGGFVNEKLDQGLRGQELADAIRQEHAARGKGHGASKGKGKKTGHYKNKGKDEDSYDEAVERRDRDERHAGDDDGSARKTREAKDKAKEARPRGEQEVEEAERKARDLKEEAGEEIEKAKERKAKSTRGKKGDGK